MIEKTKSISADERPLNAFYGSSSIRLWDQMNNDLHPHHTVNLGFGGSSYYWCNHFFEEVFQHVNPHRVILYAGDNDLGSGTSQEEILRNIERLHSKIKTKNPHTQVIIISVKPSPNRLSLRDKTEKLNQEIASFITSENGDFINVFSEMLSTNGTYRPELYVEDMLHLNEKGYEIWKRVVGAYLDEA